MEDKITRISNKAFAVIFAVLFITTLFGIIFKGAWWHIPTLVVTGILTMSFIVSDKEDKEDKSPI